MVYRSRCLSPVSIVLSIENFDSLYGLFRLWASPSLLNYILITYLTKILIYKKNIKYSAIYSIMQLYITEGKVVVVVVADGILN